MENKEAITVENAIEIIKIQRQGYTEGRVNYNALSMAIEALEQMEQDKDWKKQFMAVWEDVDSYARNNKEIRLGESVATFALKLMKERDKLIEQMEKPKEGGSSDLKKLSMNIVNQILDIAETSVEKRQNINDVCDEFVFDLLSSQLPCNNSNGEVKSAKDIRSEMEFIQECIDRNKAISPYGLKQLWNRLSGIVDGIEYHNQFPSVKVAECSCTDDVFCHRCCQSKGWERKSGEFVKVVTDEEIENNGKRVFNDAGHTIFTHYNTVPSWIEGAKWLRSRMSNNKTE